MFFEAHVYLHKDFQTLKIFYQSTTIAFITYIYQKNEYKLNYTNADISFHVNRQ